MTTFFCCPNKIKVWGCDQVDGKRQRYKACEDCAGNCETRNKTFSPPFEWRDILELKVCPNCSRQISDSPSTVSRHAITAIINDHFKAGLDSIILGRSQIACSH